MLTNPAFIDLGALSQRAGKKIFPLREEVRYKLVKGEVVTTGVGETVNICSKGVMFTTEQRLPIGRNIELSVNWPVLLNGSCPLKFVVYGRIVLAEADRAEVIFQRHEFRTRSQRRNNVTTISLAPPADLR